MQNKSDVASFRRAGSLNFSGLICQLIYIQSIVSNSIRACVCTLELDQIKSRRASLRQVRLSPALKNDNQSTNLTLMSLCKLQKKYACCILDRILKRRVQIGRLIENSVRCA